MLTQKTLKIVIENTVRSIIFNTRNATMHVDHEITITRTNNNNRIFTIINYNYEWTDYHYSHAHHDCEYEYGNDYK